MDGELVCVGLPVCVVWLRVNKSLTSVTSTPNFLKSRPHLLNCVEEGAAAKVLRWSFR